MIKPGESDTVTATVQSIGRRTGLTAKSVAVATNDPANREKTLWCKGEVRTPFRDLDYFVNFDRIERSAGAQAKTITLRRGDGGPIAPEVMPVENELVKTALREITPGEHYELDLTVRPPWPNTLINELITIKTGVVEAPEYAMRMVADIAPRVETSPERFTIAEKHRDSRDYRALLLWESNAAQKAVGAAVNDAQLSVRIEEKDNMQQVVLRVPAGYVRKAADPVVTIRTDDKEVPEFSVPVTYVKVPERQVPEGKNPPARTGARRTGRSSAPGQRTAPGNVTQPQPAPPPTNSAERQKTTAPQAPPPPADKPVASEKPAETDKPASSQTAPKPDKPKDEGA